jgi:ADP-ribosylglycohydrolase
VIGAVAGDVIGSVFERNSVKRKDFTLFSPVSRFTDDTVLTLAVAEAIIEKTVRLSGSKGALKAITASMILPSVY